MRWLLIKLDLLNTGTNRYLLTLNINPITSKGYLKLAISTVNREIHTTETNIALLICVQRLKWLFCLRHEQGVEIVSSVLTRDGFYQLLVKVAFSFVSVVEGQRTVDIADAREDQFVRDAVSLLIQDFYNRLCCHDFSFYHAGRGL